MAEGKNIHPSRKYPANVNFPDSVWFQPAPQNPDTNKRVMYIRATDPPGRGNYVRYFTKKNSEPFLPGENVFDDQVIDGTTYQIQLPQGVNRNDPAKRGQQFLQKGDTVTLKFCCDQ